MKCAYFGLVALTFVTGITAAVYWYQSSRIPATPTWKIEPGDQQLSQAGWVAGTLEALSASARLNSRAAIWTALSVALAAFSSLIGFFAHQ